MPIRGLVGTMRRCFRPSTFWQDLKLTDHIQIGPVLVLAGVIFVAPFAFHALWGAWTVHANLRIYGLPPGITGVYAIDLLLNSRYVVYYWIERRIPGPLVVLLGMPLLFLLLPVTLQKAKIRRTHVLRIWLYSLIAPMLVFLIWCLMLNLTWRPGWVEYTWILNPWAWLGHFGAAERYVYLIWSSLVGIAIALACVWWVSRWWLKACEDYLELPEARLIVRVMVLILFMTAVVVQIFTNTQLQ